MLGRSGAKPRRGFDGLKYRRYVTPQGGRVTCLLPLRTRHPSSVSWSAARIGSTAVGCSGNIADGTSSTAIGPCPAPSSAIGASPYRERYVVSASQNVRRVNAGQGRRNSEY